MKKRKKCYLKRLFFALLILLTQGAVQYVFAVDSTITSDEKVTIKGTVKDPMGEPLPGVNIIVKGTITGVATDADGIYMINVSSRSDILVFSYTGFIKQELTVGNKTIIDVVLKEDVLQFEEVVVIGYGAVKKSDLTGSVASVSSRQFQSQPITRLDQAINGRAAGVSVISNSGQPDQNIRMRVRGMNSINTSNDPLYVVDGVPNSNLFYNLDANDVQSIEILKDASATAIYGSRGANGVILVTTKRGSEGKAKIQFSTNQTWNTLPEKVDLLDASEFAEFYNEYRKQKNNATNDYFSSEEIENWRINGGTDWQDLIYRTAKTQEYKLSVSGGSEKVKYMFSGNILDNEGLLLNSGLKRYGIRANVTAQALNWLKIDFETTASQKKIKNNGGSAVSGALGYSPTLAPQNENGDWNNDNIGMLQTNPLGSLIENKNDQNSNYSSSNIQFLITLPVKGLSTKVQAAYNYRNTKGYVLNSSLRDISKGNPNSASNSQDENFDWYSLTQVNYENTWGDHKLNAFVGAEFSKGASNSMSISVNSLRTESVGYWNLNLGNISSFGNSYSEASLASFIGRAIYQFKDRYMFTATLRHDGSSSFQNNKWANFPSVALAWKASEESFIKDLAIFDMLKIRGSYGITGNQGVGIYETLGLMTQSNYGWGTSTALPGYWQEKPSNPDLSWEKTMQWDAGIDVAFWENRISATADFYIKTTKDLLLDKAIPYYNGGGTSKINIGEVRNQGMDFTLAVIPVQSKNVFWESRLNLSYTKNKVIDMGGQEQLHPGTKDGRATINTAVLKVGEPMGSIYGYVWEGLWRTDEAEEAAKWGQKPGDNKFKDKNGNYQLESEDAEIIGKAFPDYTLGWNNTLSWKNFEFNVFFQAAFGAQRLNLMRYMTSEAISDSRFITYKKAYYNMWTPENQNTNVPNHYSDTYNTRFETTQYLENADYFRLKNVNISYKFPRSMTKIGDLKLSLSAQNLYTFTSYTGYDPELSTTSGNVDTNAGIDGGVYPLSRSFTVGLELTF